MKKHRLILLLGILVALIFFYLGINTWVESQQKVISTPPPVVGTKPPAEIKKEAKPVKPEEPKQEQEDAQLAKLPAAESAKVQEGPEPKKDTQITQQEGAKAGKEEAKEVKKTPKKPEKPPKELKKEPKNLREYILQIGAFRNRSYAERTLKTARKKGYRAFLVQEEGLYKVRVKVSSPNLRKALKHVRKDFRGAFAVMK